MKTLLYVVAIICCPALAHSQDISGIWKGTMYNDSTKQTLEYEVAISKQKGRYTGYSHTWFLINEKKYYGFKKIKVHKAKDGKVIIEDDALLDNNYPVPPNKHVRQLNVLDLLEKGTESELDGIFVTNQTKEFRELTGKIKIRKVSQLNESDLAQYLQKHTIGENMTLAK